jgi:hypothetical protein
MSGSARRKGSEKMAGVERGRRTTPGVRSCRERGKEKSAVQFKEEKGRKGRTDFMASLVASDEVVGAVVDAAPVVAVDAMNVEKRQLRQNRGGQVEEENEEKEKNDTQECPFEFPAVEVVGDLLTVLILCTLKSEALVHVVSQQRRIAGRGRKGEEENEYRRTGPSSQVRAT